MIYLISQETRETGAHVHGIIEGPPDLDLKEMWTNFFHDTPSTQRRLSRADGDAFVNWLTEQPGIKKLEYTDFVGSYFGQ